MDAVIKSVVEGPLYLLLVVAGLGFLFVSVAGKIGDRISPDKAGRLGAGGIGACLLVMGLMMSVSASAPPRSASAPSVSPATAPEISAPANAAVHPAPANAAVLPGPANAAALPAPAVPVNITKR